MRRERVVRAVRAGLVGGLAVVYSAAAGMVEQFNTRNLVGSFLTLGRLLVVVPPLLAGYLAVRPRLRGGVVTGVGGGAAVALGALAGLLTAIVTSAGVGIAHAFDTNTVRSIFQSVSPVTLSIVTLDHPVASGIPLLIAVHTALGALGAAAWLVPRPARRTVTIAVGTTLAFGALQGFIPPMLDQLGLLSTWLYSATFGGLTVTGAVLVLVVTLAIAGVWAWRGERVREWRRGLAPGPARTARLTGLGVGLLVLVLVPLAVGSAVSQILGTVGIYLLMGLGLNIVVGYAGLLDLGYVAFFATGAYVTAVLTAGANSGSSIHIGMSVYLAIPLVVLVAAAVGLLIGAPVLRLRGDYLAIVTLGFGEIARVLVTSDALKGLLGGAQGLSNVPPAPIGGISFQDPQPFYYLVLAFCLLAVYVSVRLASSRIGRAWNAMREDEQVAEAMGISTTKYKLLAFALGASFGSISGALFAVQIGSLAPTSFNVLVSITALALIILGGMGSIPGVVVGAVVLIGLPGLLSEFEQYRLLLYGGVLVLIMILRPQGLVPNVRRSRELHEEDREQDAWLKRAGDASVDATITVGAAAEADA